MNMPSTKNYPKRIDTALREAQSKLRGGIANECISQFIGKAGMRVHDVGSLPFVGCGSGKSGRARYRRKVDCLMAIAAKAILFHWDENARVIDTLRAVQLLEKTAKAWPNVKFRGSESKGYEIVAGEKADV